MKDRNRAITRRHFINRAVRDAGLLAVGGVSITTSMRLARGASPGKDPNPFAYDVERLRKTDPKLIHYEQVGHFVCPNPLPRRIVIGPEDRVYIAADNSVRVLDREGTQLRDIG